jgi:hypothetical protein
MKLTAVTGSLIAVPVAVVSLIAGLYWGGTKDHNPVGGRVVSQGTTSNPPTNPLPLRVVSTTPGDLAHSICKNGLNACSVTIRYLKYNPDVCANDQDVVCQPPIPSLCPNGATCIRFDGYSYVRHKDDEGAHGDKMQLRGIVILGAP